MAWLFKFRLVILFLLSSILISCSGGGGSSGSTKPIVSGKLAFNNDSLYVTKGSTSTATLSLIGGVNVHSLAVNLSTSNSSIALVNPDTCYLSSTSDANSCRVVVHGLATGNVSLIAAASGYQSASSTSTVGTAPSYGVLVINGHTSDFSISGQAGQTIALLGSLSESSSGLYGIPINISTSASAATITPPQINVDSSLDINHYAQFLVTLPNTLESFQLTAAVVGNLAPQYAPITITVNPQSTPVKGRIKLDPSNVAVPLGMSSPAWVTLEGSSGVGDITLSLSSSNTSIATVTPSTCVISSVVPICGLAIKSVAAGQAIISATTTSGYQVSPITAIVTPPSASGRTITFTNNNESSIWVGITSGTSNSYVSSLGVPSPSQATTCGPSNPMGACPTGSICAQGGANPGKTTTYFCYWQQPAPLDGNYQLQKNNHPTTSIFVSNSSYDPIKDITWSGNFYARQLCDSTGNCKIASCGNATSGFACALGTGGSPAIVSLAETTLQAVNNDYYDISLINGSNVPMTFAPESNSQTQESYFCGVPGDFTAQSGLNASPWNFESTVLATGESAIYYNYVDGTGSTPACTTNESCTAYPGTTCGYNSDAVNNGVSSTYTLTCGKHLAWLTSDEIWALNTSTSSNLAPFPFAGSYNTNTGGAVIQNYQLFECTAPTVSGYDSKTPANESGLACGCTNWAGIASPSGQCVNINSIWTQNVLPTITWVKQACPTCYTYPFDDLSSTFQCRSITSTGSNSVSYLITFY